MKRHLLFTMMSILLLLSSISVSGSDNMQQASCPEIVETVLATVDSICSSTGRNQVCYGNFLMNTTLQDGVADDVFGQVGDITDINNIASLSLSPMDDTNGYWGVAVMKLQANIPDTMPGQNVTFLLFGDVEITSAVDPEALANGEQTAMQAFYLTTGIGDAGCEEAPESGLLVQTPEGVGEINFVVNEVEVQMGSTVFFQAETTDNLTASTLEGAAVLTVGEWTFPVLEGTRQDLPVFELLAGRENSVRDALGTYNNDTFAALPLDLLEREITVRSPLNRRELAQLILRIENGEALCGEGPFPSCDYVPELLGGLPCIPPPGPGDILPDRLRDRVCPPPDDNADCVYPPGANDPPLPPEETRPFCEDAPAPDDADCVYPPGPDDPPLPDDETRPFCEDALPPDDRDCIYPPGPDSPSMADNETRPFCEGVLLPPDDGDCVMPPMPGADPLPASETRPLCDVPEPEPEGDGSD